MTTHFKVYEYTLSANASVTINTCGATCGTAGTLDTILYIYQKADGTTGGIFNSSSPCTNIKAANNDNCGGGSLLSSVTTPLIAGNFVVVVTSNGPNEAGTYSLLVDGGAATVAQFSGCTYLLNPLNKTFASAGGTGSIAVTAGAGCAWTAVANDTWIQITSGASGSGNGTVNYSVDANGVAARIGTITAAGSTFTITQEAGSVALPCIHDALVTQNPTFLRPSLVGGSVTCPGPATTYYKQYEFTLSGCASASVTAATCGTSPCSGASTLGDTVVIVYRKSNGDPSLPGSPIFSPSSPCANAVTGNNDGCGTLSSVTTTLASGNFVVVVASNGADQVGTFNLSVVAPGCTLAIATACTFSVAPGNSTFTKAGGSGSQTVTAGAGCPWMAVSNNSWIHITSGASGSGNGTANYSVDVNTSVGRSGTITVAGETVIITQEAGSSCSAACITDALINQDPTFIRPSNATPPTCPGGNPVTHYKTYEFTLTGCASAVVTAATCGTSPCSGSGTLADSDVFIYRKSDGSPSSPGSLIFDPANRCLNGVTGNNDSCGVLSSASATLSAGNFVVLVTTNGAGQVGTFSLSVTASGCILDRPPLQLLTAASRKIHGATPHDVNLPLTGEPGVECRAGGAVSGDHTLVFTFTNNVVSGGASVTAPASSKMKRRGRISNPASVNGGPIFSGNTMTVDLTGVNNAQQIMVTLSGVTDTFCHVLPNAIIKMNVLFGDTTGNKLVNASDVSEVEFESGHVITSANFRDDVTVVDGNINSTDVSTVQAQSGTGSP